MSPLVWHQYAILPLGIQLLFAGIYGAAFGSFMTMLAHRLPLMLLQQEDMPSGAGAQVNLFQPSACAHCGWKIPPCYNIPIIGWLLTRGRCAHCGAPVSVRYLLLELISLAASVGCLLKFGPGLRSVTAFGFVWALTLAASIDFETLLLPDVITLPLLWCGLLLSAWRVGPAPDDAILGTALAYGVLFVASRAVGLASGTCVMGDGDLKLYAAIGAWLGWQAVPQTLLIASLGSVLSRALPVLWRSRDGGAGMVPFGPWLATAAVATVFGGTWW
jgi:leader peptidase (prepilin peptidase)/N-methyltransferase